MKINTKLSIVDYMMVVEEIVQEFFDIDGEYKPHFGELNAMRIFYNYCTEPEVQIVDLLEMQEIIERDEFIDAYSAAIRLSDGSTPKKQLDFYNAYYDAKEIVYQKVNSYQCLATAVENAMKTLFDTLLSRFNNDSMQRLIDVAEKVADKNIDEQAIAEAYGKSARFENNTQEVAKAMAERFMAARKAKA